jgi:hypothetical protein
VVDDLETVRSRAERWDVDFYEGWDCSFWDPFGYRVEVLRQSDVSKAPSPYDPGPDKFLGHGVTSLARSTERRIPFDRAVRFTAASRISRLL